MKMRLKLLAAGLVTACLPYGQASSNPVPAPLNIERDITQEITSFSAPSLLAPEADVSSQLLNVPDFIEVLGDVSVDFPSHLASLSNDIVLFWQDFHGMAVQPKDVQNFKDWVWTELQSLGYLAYVILGTDTQADGKTSLHVAALSPRLNDIRFNFIPSQQDTDLDSRFTEQFLEFHQVNELVDITRLESTLDSLSYRFPYQMSISLRQLDAENIDLIVNVEDRPYEPGQFQRGFAELNNYGLSSYGREQFLIVGQWTGATPLSEVLVVAQVSRGVRYARLQYSDLLQGTGVRWNTWLSTSHSQIASNRYFDRSHMIGMGLKDRRTLGRNGVMFVSSDLSHRASGSAIESLRLSAKSDTQLSISALTNSYLFNAPTHFLTTESAVVIGELRIQSQDFDYGLDVNNIEGAYYLFKHNGLWVNNFAPLLGFSSEIHWSGQLANRNLDTYNQFSPSGIRGLRAFYSNEGTGDQGARVSFELKYKIDDQATIAGFYDTAYVQDRIFPVADHQNNYRLHALGVYLDGREYEYTYRVTLAKSLGSTPSVPNAITSDIGDIFLGLAIRRAF